MRAPGQARAALAAALQRVAGTDAELLWQRWYELEMLLGDGAASAVDAYRASGATARPYAGASLAELHRRWQLDGLALGTAGDRDREGASAGEEGRDEEGTGTNGVSTPTQFL